MSQCLIYYFTNCCCGTGVLKNLERFALYTDVILLSTYIMHTYKEQFFLKLSHRIYGPSLNNTKNILKNYYSFESQINLAFNCHGTLHRWLIHHVNIPLNRNYLNHGFARTTITINSNCYHPLVTAVT